MRVITIAIVGGGESGHSLTSSSKAVGFNGLSEPSRFKGVRQFWQYMVLSVLVHG